MKKILLVFTGIFLLVACGSRQAPQEPSVTPPSALNDKFIIKASNSQFVAVATNGALVPNQTDPTKATVFEKVDAGNGRSALKASNGKFVCADRTMGGKLVANRDSFGEWETFELIALDNVRINIRSSESLFVCSNRAGGDTLIANRPNAGDWEAFDLIKQDK